MDNFYDGAPKKTESIPVMRIIDKLNELESRNNPDGAARHLEYWIGEAENVGDDKALFSLENEIMGVYRKLGIREKAVFAAERCLEVGSKIGIENSEAFGTALLNAATVYKAFGMSERALPLFQKAERTLLQTLSPSHAKMGGLYNNMALCLVDLCMYDEAERAYLSAVEVMLKNKYGQLEAAISYLNLADLYAKKEGLENACDKIEKCLDEAEKHLETEGIPKNGYYAFVCDKCAPVFDYYGRFFYADKLKKEAKSIYERD